MSFQLTVLILLATLIRTPGQNNKNVYNKYSHAPPEAKREKMLIRLILKKNVFSKKKQCQKLA